MSTRNPPHLGTLVLLTGMSVLTLNMFLPALPRMAEALGTRDSVMVLAVSGYMLVAALAQLTLGPLSDRIGRRPVVLGAMAIFTLASIGCALATDAVTFLACRLVQGVVVAGSVMSSAIVRDLYDRRQAAARLGVIAAAMALAPMMGPMLGGIVESALGWRGIFGAYTACGAALLILCLYDLGETRRTGGTRHYGPLLRSRLFWAYALCHGLSVGGFFVFLAGASFVAAREFGLGPALVGMGLGSITGGFMLGSTITARMAERTGILPLIALGRLSAILGPLASLSAFALGAESALWLFGFTIFVGFGNGLTIPNANAGALSVVPEQAGAAAGIVGATGSVLGAALTWGATLVIERSTNAPTLLALVLSVVSLSALAAAAAWRWDRGARISPAAPAGE